MPKAQRERRTVGLKYCRSSLSLSLILLALSCQPPTPPEKLVGQGIVQKVVPADRRVVIAHEDIPDFMRAMTMSFEVRDPALLEKCTPGERVRFTLEKTDQTLYLVEIEEEPAEGNSSRTPPEPSARHE
ncbi:MAG: copper-binding protein [Deltaproteobacteria bacterium]|nr:copper-binding protein [Deltaproteobacteria bacterium]